MTTPPGGPNSGTYRGREECEGYLRELITPFEASAVRPEEFFQRGDQVAVVYKVRARPKGSSAEIEIRNGAVWKIRGGKAVSLRFFPKPDDALEAAGLSE
jgi:ketosteroid isomerase-like protein